MACVHQSERLSYGSWPPSPCPQSLPKSSLLFHRCLGSHGASTGSRSAVIRSSTGTSCSGPLSPAAASSLPGDTGLSPRIWRVTGQGLFRTCRRTSSSGGDLPRKSNDVVSSGDLPDRSAEGPARMTGRRGPPRMRPDGVTSVRSACQTSPSLGSGAPASQDRTHPVSPVAMEGGRLALVLGEVEPRRKSDSPYDYATRSNVGSRVHLFGRPVAPPRLGVALAAQAQSPWTPR